MKAKTILILLGVVLVLGIGVYFVFLGTKSQEKKIADLEKEISFLKEEMTPVRYKIISQQGDQVEVSLKFYDLDGKEIAKQHFTMKGSDVSFDFYVVKTGDRYVAIPYRLFTDKIKPQDGKLLYKYYEKDDYPMIFYSKQSPKLFNEGIKALYGKIKSGEVDDIENIFGNMVQNAPQTMKNEIENKVYKIVVHTKGGIEIIEE